MRGHYAKIKNYAKYSWNEITTILVYGLVIGFIFSFDKWGTTAFDAGAGIFSLIYYVLISLFILFAVTFIQKSVGAHIGIIPTFHLSVPSLIIPLFVLLLTGGSFPFFMIPGFSTDEKLSLMLGRNRYRRGFVDYMQIGASGTLFLTLLALLFSIPVLQDLFYGVNTAFFFFAFYSLIPFDLILKPFDKKCGVSYACGIFYCSRGIYVFTILFLLFAFILSRTELFFISLLVSIMLAFILAMLYFLYEHKIFPDSN